MALRFGQPENNQDSNSGTSPMVRNTGTASAGHLAGYGLEQPGADAGVDAPAQASLAFGGGVFSQVAAIASDQSGLNQRVAEAERESAQFPVPAEVPEATRRSILEAASDMSLVQAMAPREKDHTGFNNADYPFGAVVSMSGNVRACALLLLGYPRQSDGHGLSREDLVWALPPEEQGNVENARLAAREELAGMRDENRGKVAWTEKGDKVLLVPFSGFWEDNRVLRQMAVKTPVGYEVDKPNLGRVLDRMKGEVIDRTTLAAIAEANRPPEAVVTQEPAKCRVQVSASNLGGDRWAVSWTDPFGPEGARVKEAVKAIAGGRAFDGGTRSWHMTYAQTQVLAVMLAEVEEVDPTGLPVHPDNVPAAHRREAEMLMAGVTPVKVRGTNPEGKVLFGTAARNDALYQACRAEEIRWNGVCYEADPAKVVALVERLATVVSLDCSELVKTARGAAREALRAAQEARLALEAARTNVGAMAIPDFTPTGRAFFPHQKDGIRFLLTAGLTDVHARGAILADDMGLGKSVQSIEAAFLKNQNGRKLVVCPASLRLNWAKEIGLWLGPEEKARVQVLSSGGKAIDPAARWLVINYDLLKKYAEDLEAWKPEIAIYDEAHLLKNSDAQRSKVVVGVDIKTEDPYTGRKRWFHEPGLAEKIPTNWVLTGTPIKNRTKELYSLIRIIGHELGKDYFKFGVRYCDGHKVQVGIGKEVWDFDGSSNLDELGEKLRPVFLKREKSEVLNLPPKIESVVPVELTAAELKTYKQALKELLGKDIDAPDDEGPKAPGGVLRKMTAMKMHTAIAKIPAAMDIIDSALDSGQKIVVFTTYHEVLDQLQERYQNLAVRLDGSTSKTKRQEVVDSFQEDPSKMVFLGQTDAAGVGITLTAAQEALVVDWPWVPGDYRQARDRIYRIGQTGTCNIRGLCAEGTFDNELQETLKAKIELIEAVERAIKEGKVVDPEILAKANEDVAMLVFKKMKKEAKRIQREEKKDSKKTKPTTKKAVNE